MFLTSYVFDILKNFTASIIWNLRRFSEFFLCTALLRLLLESSSFYIFGNEIQYCAPATKFLITVALLNLVPRTSICSSFKQNQCLFFCSKYLYLFAGNITCYQFLINWSLFKPYFLITLTKSMSDLEYSEKIKIQERENTQKNIEKHIKNYHHHKLQLRYWFISYQFYYNKYVCTCTNVHLECPVYTLCITAKIRTICVYLWTI